MSYKYSKKCSSKVPTTSTWSNHHESASPCSYRRQQQEKYQSSDDASEEGVRECRKPRALIHLRICGECPRHHDWRADDALHKICVSAQDQPDRLLGSGRCLTGTENTCMIAQLRSGPSEAGDIITRFGGVNNEVGLAKLFENV